MKGFFRFAAVLGWAIVLVFALSDASYRKPGPFNIQIGDRYSDWYSIADRKIYYDDTVYPVVGASQNLLAFYWGNTVTYISHDTFTVTGYAIFSLNRKLLAWDHANLLLDEDIQYYMDQYGEIPMLVNHELYLANSDLPEAPFPMPFDQIYQRFGPSAGHGYMSMGMEYLLSDGRWVRLYQTNPDGASVGVPMDPAEMMMDIDFIFDPFLLHRTTPKASDIPDAYQGTHPIFKPNTEWACSSYNACYRTNSTYGDWGQGHLTINGKTISFQLLSALGGWKYASFVPLDGAGNLTHWEFQGILQKTLHGFDLIVPDCNGFLGKGSITLSFTEVT